LPLTPELHFEAHCGSVIGHCWFEFIFL
jgi:hypothetical protein